jgi:hypothetical protein
MNRFAILVAPGKRIRRATRATSVARGALPHGLPARRNRAPDHSVLAQISRLAMSNEPNSEPLLDQVEEDQAALRESIEESKRLVEESQELIDRVKEEGGGETG